MTEKAKLVRGTVAGNPVQTSEENAERLGVRFEPESKTPAKKAAASNSAKK